LPPDLPRHTTAAYRRGHLLPKLLLDHRLPRHQTEFHAVIQHRVAPAGEHDGTLVDAGHALLVCDEGDAPRQCRRLAANGDPRPIRSGQLG